MIELKWTVGINSNDCSGIPNLIKVIEDKGFRNTCIILTSMKPCLEYIKTNYPDIQLQYLCYSQSFESSFDWCKTWGIDIDSAIGSEITRSLVKKYHDAGLKVNVWTINDNGYYSIYYHNYECDFVTTDYLDPENLPVIKELENSGDANIYASGLKLINNGTELQFTLNAPGDVSINFYKEKTKVHSIEEKGLEKGVHTISLTGEFPENVKENDQLTWEIVATGKANTEIVPFYNPSRPEQQFFAAGGLAVNNNPKSPNFGHLYIANGCAGETTLRTTEDGIYILDAQLTDVTNQGDEAYSGNVAWIPGEKRRPNSPKEGGTYVSDGKFTNAEGKTIHGSVESICIVYDSKGDKYILTQDEEVYAESKAATGAMNKSVAIQKYKIGESYGIENLWSSFYQNTGNGTAIDPTCVNDYAADNNGGIWITQNGATANYPFIMHITSEGKCDYTSSVVNKLAFAIAVNNDNTILAIATSDNKVTLYDLSIDNNAISCVEREAFDLGYTEISTRGILAFDVADNLYMVNTLGYNLEAYALPKANNTYITPANETITISNTMTGVESTISNNDIAIFSKDGSIIVNGSDNNKVEVYSVNGQCVYSGTDR